MRNAPPLSIGLGKASHVKDTGPARRPPPQGDVQMNDRNPGAYPEGPLETAPKDRPTGYSISDKATTFPHLPGVYLFKAPDGRVLYVGKARDIRKRVASYFRSDAPENIKTRALLQKAIDLEYVVTSTEKEALLLEASLIKRHRPRYNVILRDDKNYPALRIDPRDPFPRLDVVRRFQKDGALYFGPYPSAHAVRETLKLLNQLFPLRQCRGKKLVPRQRPCLNHSLGRCPGACAGKIDRVEYGKIVDEVVLFLQGKTDVLQVQLRKNMQDAAESLEFERAAIYRNRLQAIASMLEKQGVISDRFINQDVLGICQQEDSSEIALLFVRQGTVTGHRNFDLKDAQGEEEELLTSFIQQYYGEGHYIPDEILIPVPIEAQSILQDWLVELKGKHARIWHAQRGERRHLLELADRNARERLGSRIKWEKRDIKLLEALQRVLKLPRQPDRMACVDISNIQGQHAVGALVVFDRAQPDKASYRSYHIHGKAEPDDPAMMAEVIERLIEDDPELASGLDLLVLDGGKGHLGRIGRLIEELGVGNTLPVISIAKEQESDVGEKGRGLYEKIYLPGRKNPLFLSRYPDLLHLLMRLRDEAHRFAISNYQALHRRELLVSFLDSIPGVGQRRKQALVRHFGSVENIANASPEEIAKTPGIPRSIAVAVHAAILSRHITLDH